MHTGACTHGLQAGASTRQGVAAFFGACFRVRRWSLQAEVCNSNQSLHTQPQYVNMVARDCQLLLMVFGR